MAAPKIINSVGRRKSAVARVYLKKGDGQFVINHSTPEKYFDTDTHLNTIYKPLILADSKNAVDIKINVKGGGKSGQSGAILLGISRALCKYDDSLHAILKEHKLLTRDSRKVERKKYGQKGARKKFQFSKR